MEERICPMCKRKVQGRSYEVGVHKECCKQCYDEKRMSDYMKTNPDALRYARYNLTLSFIGMLASVGVIVGVLFLVMQENVSIGIGLIASCVIIIGTTVFGSFKIDKKLNALLKRKFPKMKSPYEIPDEF